MKVDGQAHAQHLARGRRRDRRHHRPDRCCRTASPRSGSTTLQDAARAIKTMQVRGAPLIGAAAAYGICLALRDDASDEALERAYAAAARDAADRDQSEMGARRDDGGGAQPPRERARRGRLPARRAKSPTRTSRSTQAIGRHGLKLIEEIAATQEAGRAGQRAHPLQRRLARDRRLGHRDRRRSTPAHDKGIPIHVWVDETRPRNQGASLTAWELGQHGVPHTVIPDNTGGHLMQHAQVDIAIVGTDRVTAQGDVVQQDRHLSQGARRQGQRRAVLCGAAVADHRLHASTTASRKSRSSSAAPTKSPP